MESMRLRPIKAPGFCRPAWIRFLRREGASITEIASALQMCDLEVARRVAELRRRRPVECTHRKITR